MTTDAASDAWMKPLPASFYEGRVLDVARAMIGKLLVHRSDEGVLAGRIVECEAYRGPEDLAAHSAGGRRTRRTEVMFGPPGRAYMYFIYGMHWAFNVVVGREGEPHAILVRAIEPTVGVARMAGRRGLPETSRAIANGPGKLCSALGLAAWAYGLDLTGDRVFLAEGADAARERSPDAARVRSPDAARERSAAVGRSARINVDYAGAWAARPWRFYEKGNQWVSVPPRG